MPDFTLRDATDADMSAIAGIYNYYVEKTTDTWDLRPMAYIDQVNWMAARKNPFCAIVAVIEGEIVAWGSYSTYRNKLGYRYTVENSLYVKPEYQRRGLGTAILQELTTRAKANGFHVVIARVCAENQVSIDLHLKQNFTEVGREHEVGFKFERWLDVVTLQRILA